MHDDEDDTTCCAGFTLDVTVGEIGVQLHGHALLTPELADTFLARLTRHATQAEVIRIDALIRSANKRDAEHT